MAFVGIDLGTSSVKVLVLDQTGRTLAHASRSYPLIGSRLGRAESDPEAWWSATCEAAREAVETSGTDVDAIGLSGQMHGVIVVDAAGTVLRHALTWADTRAAQQLKHYRRLAPHVRARLGNPLAPGMAGPLLLWLREHEPDVYKSAQFALQAKDWLRLRLTGHVATDPSDASATLLYDIERDAWDLELVEEVGLRPDLLPPLQSSTEVAAGLRAHPAGELGLTPGTPVVSGAADTACALVGAGVVAAGALLNVGTGAQIAVPAVAAPTHPRLLTHAYRSALQPPWYGMAAIQNAGFALDWVREALGASWDELYEHSLRNVQPGAGGVTFLPQVIPERTPLVDGDAGAAWVGLRAGHGRLHLLRAALEGVAFAVREGIEALEETGLAIDEVTASGGSMRRPLWRRLLAAVLERPLVVSAEPAASARGAAVLAAIGVGATDARLDRNVRAAEPGDLPGEDEIEACRAAYRLYLARTALLSRPHP